MIGRISLQTKIAPLAMLCLGIPILQFHAIVFWVEAVGDITGWIWPILLEIAALWLWSWNSWWRRGLGSIVTLVLLSGPIYQVGTPVVREILESQRAVQSVDIRVTDLRTRISGLQGSLDIYLRNSETRIGWYPLIKDAEDRIESERAKLAELVKTGGHSATSRLTWQGWSVLVLQLLSLVLFQTFNVLAILTLAANRPPAPIDDPVKVASEPVSPPKPDTLVHGVAGITPIVGGEGVEVVKMPINAQSGVRGGEGVEPEPFPVTNTAVRLLQAEIKRRVAAGGEGLNAWCITNNVNKKYIWLIANHFAHTSEGKEVIADKKFAELYQKFLPTKT